MGTTADIQLTIDDRDVKAALNRSLHAVEPATRKALIASAEALVNRQRDNLTKHGRIDRGDDKGLLGAISFVITGRRANLTATVGPTAKDGTFFDQARTVEGGRAAGSKMPPPGALLPWLGRKGKPPEAEFPIGAKIAREGIPAAPFVGPSLEQEAHTLDRNAESILDAIAAAFDS